MHLMLSIPKQLNSFSVDKNVMTGRNLHRKRFNYLTRERPVGLIWMGPMLQKRSVVVFDNYPSILPRFRDEAARMPQEV